MRPDAAGPERGSFVRDQVAALARIDGVEVELHEFAPGPRALVAAARELRALAASASAERAPFDVVHAHFGLTAWPALAVPARVHALTVHGTDLSHPRTRLMTAAVLPRIDLLAAVSESLRAQIPGSAARRRALVLPCGVDVERFVPLPRARARAELGLDPGGPYLLFPADPSRASKRHDRARALARACGVRLLELHGVEPALVPLWVNAANAVLEALACDVPVLATPVGVHADALSGVEGALCAPFEQAAWLRALEPHLRAEDPRVAGRASAMRFSADPMARRVADAWRAALTDPGGPLGDSPSPAGIA